MIARDRCFSVEEESPGGRDRLGDAAPRAPKAVGEVSPDSSSHCSEGRAVPITLESAPRECDAEALHSRQLKGALLVVGWNADLAGQEAPVRLRGVGSLVQES